MERCVLANLHMHRSWSRSFTGSLENISSTSSMGSNGFFFICMVVHFMRVEKGRNEESKILFSLDWLICEKPSWTWSFLIKERWVSFSRGQSKEGIRFFLFLVVFLREEKDQLVIIFLFLRLSLKKAVYVYFYYTRMQGTYTHLFHLYIHLHSYLSSLICP